MYTTIIDPVDHLIEDIYPVVKYPDPPKDPPVIAPVDDPGPVPFPNPKDIDAIQPEGANVVYDGMVKDSGTGEPIQGATVDLKNNGITFYRAAADANGYFMINAGGSPIDNITITAASYKPYTSPASIYQHTFELEPDIVRLPPVVLPPGSGGKDNTLLWVIALAVVAKSQKWI